MQTDSNGKLDLRMLLLRPTNSRGVAVPALDYPGRWGVLPAYHEHSYRVETSYELTILQASARTAYRDAAQRFWVACLY